MNLLQKLFNFGNTTQPNKKNSIYAEPDIQFGHYSDNNKPIAQINLWKESEDQFTNKNYVDAIETFFNYIKDDNISNVHFTRNENNIDFNFVQGSKIIQGKIDANGLSASANVALMPTVNVPVMRKVLEINYSLNYSRFALQQNTLCMLIDAPLDTCSPNKMYYGLRELATNVDKLDDLLLDEFATLQSIDTQHVLEISEQEKEIKYNYFVQCIGDTIAKTKDVNQDTFSGGISYVHLNCLQKIDYLITPKGKLQNEIEKITNIYWNNNNEKTAVEINTQMRDALQKLLQWNKEDILKELYRTKATFSYKTPADMAKVKEIIANCQNNMQWYNNNKYPTWALEIQEYALTSVEYNYSMPSIITSFTKLFLRVNCSAYFSELGFTPPIYNAVENIFAKDYILQKIEKIKSKYQEKFVNLNLDSSLLNFTSLIEFNTSYLNMIENIDLTIA